MRLSFTLIFFAILITFSSSYFLLSQIETETRVHADSHQISEFKKYFTENYSAYEKIDIAKMYAKTDVKTLVDPYYQFYHSHIYDYDLMNFILRIKNACQSNSSHINSLSTTSSDDALSALDKSTDSHFSRFLKKGIRHDALVKFLFSTLIMDCQIEDLNFDFDILDDINSKNNQIKEKVSFKNFGSSFVFLNLKPFMSPFGQSFAQQFFLNPKNPMSEADKVIWAENHFDYFHALELKNLNHYQIHFPKDFKILSEMTEKELREMIGQSEVLLTSRFVLFRFSSNTSFHPSQYFSYFAYSLEDFEKALEEMFPKMGVRYETNNQTCLFRESNLCWYEKNDQFNAFLKQYTIVFFVTSILIVIFMIFIVYKRVAEEKLEEEKKRFALQTLTHELRTPLASINLSLEQLRDSFDKLGSNQQHALGRIFSDVARLIRLAEASKQYLGREKSKKLINFKLTNISSFNMLLNSVTEIFEDNITVEPLDPDISLQTDPYWLSICIKNLIDNAIEHGSQPVVIHSAVNKNNLVVTVTDNGRSEFTSLEQMKSAFVKNPNSKGLGLGLNLVDQIVKELGGTLHFTNKPTRFSIVLPVKPTGFKSKKHNPNSNHSTEVRYDKNNFS